MMGVPHRAKISLQSLDISDRNANMRNADITLYAGDGINGTGIIFSGKVVQPTIEKARDGFSRILSISASYG